MPAPIRPDSSRPAVSGPGLAHERDGQARRDHRLGAEALERRARVHREHDADRHAGDGDERRRSQPELEELADGFAELEGRDERARAAALNAKIDTSPAEASSVTTMPA